MPGVRVPLAVPMAPEHIRRGDTVVGVGSIWFSEPRAGVRGHWFLSKGDGSRIESVTYPMSRVSSDSVEVPCDTLLMTIPGPGHA